MRDSDQEDGKAVAESTGNKREEERAGGTRRRACDLRDDWSCATPRRGAAQHLAQLVTGALLRLAALRLLLGASAGQDAVETAVPLVAGVLVNFVLRLLGRHHQRPRLGPARWVVEGHFVLQRFRVDAREALRNLQIRAAAGAAGQKQNRALRRIVCRLDDERI